MSLSVFLCHASDDKSDVRELYKALQRDGFDPWLDEEDLLAGQDWSYQISRAVRDSDVVVACLSENSVSKAGYVQKEIKLALDVADEQPEGAIFIIPFKLEKCEVPDRLRRWHWIELDLHWSSLDKTSGYEKLVEALHSRADELGIDTTDIGSDEENAQDILYDDNMTLKGNTHISLSFELDEDDKINIDLNSNEPVDVLIMDEGDYRYWMKKGEVNLLYEEFLETDQLHDFFNAPDSDTYLVIVRNSSDKEAVVHLKISYTV
ncbi:MAG: hypothetical protein QOE33_1845 [Acidobacteriota bacterium]|nr:hypothetical protein [Acidobacteriota bacterium]